MANRLHSASLPASSSILPFVQRKFLGNIHHITRHTRKIPPLPPTDLFNNTPLPLSLTSTLKGEDHESIKDTYASALLSEVVYKGVDVGHEAAEVAVNRLKSLLPVPIELTSLSWSPRKQHQKYVMSEGPDAIYVAFLGTKHPMDLLASLDMKTTQAFLPLGDGVAVHKGYLHRASQIPCEEMYQLAAARSKRLVFTGHSMGGAVATICALHILSMLPASLHSSVQAIGFATPPLGNEVLESVVQSRGWASQIKNILLPEDWIPGALTLWRAQAQMQVAPETTVRATADLQSRVMLASDGRPAARSGTAALSATVETTGSRRTTATTQNGTTSMGAAVSSPQSTAISIEANYCFCWGYGQIRSKCQSFYQQEAWNPFSSSSWERNAGLVLAAS